MTIVPQCIFCKHKLNGDVNSYEEHLVDKHGVDKKNKIVRKYLKSLLVNDVSKVIRCNGCNILSHSARQHWRHMIKEHYNVGERNAAIMKLHHSKDENAWFKRYTFFADFKEFGSDYEWGEPGCVDAFLSNAKVAPDKLMLSTFMSTQRNDLRIDCQFSIINCKNIGNGMFEYNHPRQWSTNFISENVISNKTIEFLSRDIQNRIINNGESGSSWMFHRFDHFQMNVILLKQNDIASLFGGRIRVISDSD